MPAEPPPTLPAALNVKRCSPDDRVTDAFCILAPSPTTSPRRTDTESAERPSQLAERRRGHEALLRGRCRRRSRCGRRQGAQLGNVEAADVGVHGDGRRALAIDTKQRLAGELARAHFECLDLDLEAVALGRALGVQRVGPAEGTGSRT